MLRNVLGAIAAASLGSAVLAAGVVGPTRADARALQEKVTGINRFAAAPTRQARRTIVTQNEVNAYLAYDAGDQIPVGVVQPSITILGGGRVAARAVVDLDAVRKQKSPRSLLDPLNYLSGRVPMTATGTLRATGGYARMEYESGALGPVSIPKFILQEIVSYYSRTPEKPGGIDLDAPFALPARIREIQVETGRAVVVQ